MTDQERTELAELLAENQLLTHKVIACGVIADHPDATLGDRHPYSTEWNSQQADRVRGLRRRHEEALAVIAKLARFAEAYEPRTRNTEVEQLDVLKRARALLANASGEPDAQRIGAPTPLKT